MSDFSLSEEAVVYPAYYYNIREILGYSYIYNRQPNLIYTFNFKYTYIAPPINEDLIFWYTNKRKDENDGTYIVRLTSLVISNIIDYILSSNDGVVMSTLKKHYEMEVLKNIKKSKIRNKNLINKFLASWNEVESIIEYFLSVGGKYKYCFYREYFQWSDGLNHYYQFVPLLASNDGENFDVTFVVHKEEVYNFKRPIALITSMPSCARVLGILLNRGFNIKNVNVFYLKTFFNPIRKFEVSSFVEFKDVDQDEGMMQYLREYGDEKNWKSVLSFYPSPRDHYFKDFPDTTNRSYVFNNTSPPLPLS